MTFEQIILRGGAWAFAGLTIVLAIEAYKEDDKVLGILAGLIVIVFATFCLWEHHQRKISD